MVAISDLNGIIFFIVNIKILLILSAALIILGAILKITHSLEKVNNWIFISGYFFGLIYFLMRGKMKQG
jgi:hypothetical protein